MVGPEEIPFGLQKDLLCSVSGYFKLYFDDAPNNIIEHVVKIPETTVEVFGLAQTYIYTQEVWPDDQSVPTYEELFALWQLGLKYEIDGLCDKTLECMQEVKQRTRQIPGASLVSRVWKETDEGTPIRRLFLQWAEEYFQSSDAPADFAKSLPQEFLCELVVEMSSIASGPASGSANSSVPPPSADPSAAVAAIVSSKKNVHYLAGVADSSEDDTSKSLKKQRRNPLPLEAAMKARAPSAPQPSRPRKSLTSVTKKPVMGRRISGGLAPDGTFTDVQKVEFCADLLTRMLSGPGYWTRLVKPFRTPVDPVADGVPDYLDKVKQPMDLMTIKSKMDRRAYESADAFAGDVRLIVDNCKAYWKKGDPLYAEAERFSKSFEEKFAEMGKWLTKMNTFDQA
ncbi:related to RING3 kinase [Cephalotrichum gorgonifer]|uniref:Related to RING3 kinase n=1 Tax=Cephalotrichum gorgonifer TaxID=2041049 RepID=A0AAE8MRW4_9PEZI|nr:related to RING3 kinase [Cephalotrichum gorgonifer]